MVTVGEHEFIFVDGGVTMYNNPAFHLFLMATVKPYKLEWPTGEDKMLLLSIGTGMAADSGVPVSKGKRATLERIGAAADSSSP